MYGKLKNKVEKRIGHYEEERRYAFTKESRARADGSIGALEWVIRQITELEKEGEKE